uniref:Ig-like domain-containing protein n=1 Tax=Otolemur garnettii TaxID=30611 RepID=H0XRJ2_OTOGA
SAQLWGVCTMACTPLLLLTLFLHCTGSLSQPVLTQPPSASVSLGSSVSGIAVAWHQQQPGKAPQYLMYVASNGSHSKGDGISDRFSGSGSGLQCYLTISNLQSEDEANYYCQTYHSSGIAHS